MKNFLKTVSLIFAALFIAAAAVQYNDPDRIKWIAVYGIAALVALRVFFNNIPPLLVTIIAAVYLIWGIVSWPENFVGISLESGNIEDVEQGREALGLLFTGLVMVVFAYGIRKVRA